MHPHEAYKRKNGTGRLTNLTLENSEILIDVDFHYNKRILELLQNPRYAPLVLYPGDSALSAESFPFTDYCQGRIPLIFVIDATWSLAGKMMFHSPNLGELPRLTFAREYRSRYQFKRQPAEHCLSTLESTYYLLEELKTAGICKASVPTENLMTLFDTMVKAQLDSHEQGAWSGYKVNSDSQGSD